MIRTFASPFPANRYSIKNKLFPFGKTVLKMSQADVYFKYYSHCFFGPESSFIDPNMSIILIFSLLSLPIPFALWHVGIITGLINDHEILILCSALRVRISSLSCILMHSQPRKMSFSGLACPHQSHHQETPARLRANNIASAKGQQELQNSSNYAFSHFWHLLFRVSNCRYQTESWWRFWPEPRKCQNWSVFVVVFPPPNHMNVSQVEQMLLWFKKEEVNCLK